MKNKKVLYGLIVAVLLVAVAVVFVAPNLGDKGQGRLTLSSNIGLSRNAPVLSGTMTRCELIKAVVVGAKLSIVTPANTLNPTFSDVPRSHWCYQYAETAHAYFNVGYANGTFGPNLLVNRAEAVTLINKGFNVRSDGVFGPVPYKDVAKEYWFAMPISDAYKAGMLTEASPGPYFVPGEFALKNWCMSIINRAPRNIFTPAQ